MLVFFPNPYPDEVLYSVFARYHIRSGNIDYKNTKRELFGDDNSAPSSRYESKLEKLVDNLPVGVTYSVEDFLYNNTLYPLYSPFLKPKKCDSVHRKVTFQKCTGLYKNGESFRFFKFCPHCNKGDFEKYGELYWHRVHQIQGVLICPIHKKSLYYSDVLCQQSGYINPTFNNTNNQILEIKELSSFNIDKLYGISKDCEWLLNNRVPPKPLSFYKDNYISLLKIRGFNDIENIDHKLLFQKIKDDYGEEFIALLNSEQGLYSSSLRYFWGYPLLKGLETPYPIRHILMSHFLNETIETIIIKNFKE